MLPGRHSACRYLLALYGIFFALPSQAGQPGFATQLVGGTVPQITPKSAAQIDLSDPETFILRCRKADLRMPYLAINSLEYGQSVSRRYAEAILISPVLLLSKSRKHFVTIGYIDTSGRQQALVLRVGKGEIRSVLAGLEARTGRRVEYQDSEARKAGR